MNEGGGWGLGEAGRGVVLSVYFLRGAKVWVREWNWGIVFFRMCKGLGRGLVLWGEGVGGG